MTDSTRDNQNRLQVLSDAEITACAKASLDNAGQAHQWLFARAIEAAVLAKFGDPVAYRTLVGDYGDCQKYNYNETDGEQALYALAERTNDKQAQDQ